MTTTKKPPAHPPKTGRQNYTIPADVAAALERELGKRRERETEATGKAKTTASDIVTDALRAYLLPSEKQQKSG